MGFYRIFCVPHGGKPANGAYIRYPFDAFLAVLCLETWRHDGVLIGEDLGTVPQIVRKAMKKHGMLRMWLFQFYLKPDPAKTFKAIPEMCLAALNAHDMFPFKGFWEGKDIKKLESVGAIGERKSAQITKERKRTLRGWKEIKNPFIFVIKNMALSSARFLLVNLEDLWGETKPQNLPGTTDQYPNWRKKFRQPLEDWMNDSETVEALKNIESNRKKRK
jgi:4-alpha-glucanotransferase